MEHRPAAWLALSRRKATLWACKQGTVDTDNPFSMAGSTHGRVNPHLLVAATAARQC